MFGSCFVVLVVFVLLVMVRCVLGGCKQYDDVYVAVASILEAKQKHLKKRLTVARVMVGEKVFWQPPPGIQNYQGLGWHKATGHLRGSGTLLGSGVRAVLAVGLQIVGK